MPTSLKVTSRAAGIKAVSPFDWTKDKAIYQRWQLWSEKARHALDCMEGDSVKAKISYFHHWIDSPGMAHIESWKNNKTLISQEDYEKLDETQKEGKYSLGFQETYLHGPTLWQIPMDKIAHGRSGCPGHFPIQAGCHLYWHGKCPRNC